MPVRLANLDAAINELENEVRNFFAFFENEPGIRTQHPVFGDLNFEDWILLHYKHVSHHLKQFNLLPETANNT
jgi:hydroxymethylglutaryl-CoA reductase